MAKNRIVSITVQDNGKLVSLIQNDGKGNWDELIAPLPTPQPSNDPLNVYDDPDLFPSGRPTFRNER